MAVTVAELQARLSADTRNFDRTIGSSESKMSKFGKAAGVAALAAGAGIAYGLGKVAKIGWDEFNQGQKVAAQTNAVLKSTGGVANVTAKQVGDLAKSLMLKSGIDDEVIASGENMLLTFKGIRNEVGRNNDIFNQATELTLDMSVAMGKDLNSAAVMVGKALNDPVKGLTALTRVGVTFTDQQAKMIEKLVKSGDTMKAQKIILEELQSEFGGSAKAAGETLGGQLSILRERFNNWSGDVVAKAIPALKDFLGFLGDVAGVIADIAKGESPMLKMRVIFEGVEDAVSGLFDTLRGFLLGEAARVEPLKLETGKIVEWQRISGTSGFIATLADALRAVNWEEVGKTIGAAIGDAIDFGTAALDSMAAWVNSHVDELADIGAKIGLTIVSKLLDPVWWAQNWQLSMVVALSVFKVGPIFKIGGRIGAVLTRAFGDEAIKGFRRFFKILDRVLAPIPRLLRAAFRLGFFYTALVALREFFEFTWDKIVDFFEFKWNALRRNFWFGINRMRDILGLLRQSWNFTVDFFRDKGQLVWEKIQAVINKLKDMVAFIKSIPDQIRDALGGIGGFFSGVASRLGRAIGDGVIDVSMLRAAQPGGLNPQILDELGAAQSMGLTMTSGYRPGAITSTGNPSLHGVGKAIDVAGPASKMAAFFRAMLGRPGIRELLYSPIGGWYGSGGIVPLSGSVLRDHYSHVHLGIFDDAMRKARYLQPGWTLAGNFTGSPEPVGMAAGGGGTTYNFNGPVLDGERLLRYIREQSERSRRAGGRG